MSTYLINNKEFGIALFPDGWGWTCDDNESLFASATPLEALQNAIDYVQLQIDLKREEDAFDPAEARSEYLHRLSNRPEYQLGVFMTMSPCGAFLYDLAKAHAEEYAKGNTLTIPTEEMIRVAFEPRQLTNPDTLKVMGQL